MSIIQARRLLGPDGLVPDGWVQVARERIRAWGTGVPPGPVDVFVRGLVAPGFVDVHAHGGGGASFGSDLKQVTTVIATHLRHGTTTMVASLVTAGIADLSDQIAALSHLVADGRLAGIHLEGPWLAPSHRGAHSESLLVAPSAGDADRLLDAGAGAVRMVTIAPELPGATAAIERLVARGVVVAVGHTGADYDTTRTAIAAGATGATHLFNAMPDVLHRSPGPALALWRDPAVWVELVADGVHVHPGLVCHVISTKPDRVVLVTDAMSAAGAGDGDYELGGLPVEVRSGVARLAGTTTIAGSTLTLDRAVRTAVAAGADLETTLRAVTCHPADYLGLADAGRITDGARADLVCLDDDLMVTGVMYRGQWAVGPPK